jgi:hypothetical protein
MLGRSLSHPPPKLVLPCLITDDPPIISAKGSLLLPADELTAPPLKFRPERGGLDEAAAPNMVEKSSFFCCEKVCPPSKLLRKSKTSLFVGLLSDYFAIGFSSKSSFSIPDAND